MELLFPIYPEKGIIQLTTLSVILDLNIVIAMCFKTYVAQKDDQLMRQEEVPNNYMILTIMQTI